MQRCHVDTVLCTGDVLTFGSYILGFVIFCTSLCWLFTFDNVINESFVLINLNIGNEISCLLVKLG